MATAQNFEDYITQIELIKNSEARLFMFLEQMPIGVFIIDKEYNIIFSNNRSNELLGWDFIQTTDLRKINSYVTYNSNKNLNLEINDYSFNELPIVKALKGIETKNEFMNLVNSKGENYQLSIHAKPILNSKKEIEYAIAVFEPIPEIQNQQPNILSDLLNYEIKDKNLTQIMEFVTYIVCNRLNIHRSGVWLNLTSCIECISLYDIEKKTYEKGMQIFKKDFPNYFNFINKGTVLPIEDSISHEATREFADIYFEPFKVYSTLDCPIFVREKLYAIICCESIGKTRKWSEYEIQTIKDVCKILGMLIEKTI